MPEIIGYGSLLSLESAQGTMSDLANYRTVKIFDYVRVFDKVSRWAIRKSNTLNGQFCCLSVDERPGVELFCAAFSCSEDSFEALKRRERDYRHKLVDIYEQDGSISEGILWIKPDTLNQTIELYAENGGEELYSGPLWRRDLLPHKPYLDLCLKGAAEHGPEVLENFLQTTYLGDGKTLIEVT